MNTVDLTTASPPPRRPTGLKTTTTALLIPLYRAVGEFITILHERPRFDLRNQARRKTI